MKRLIFPITILAVSLPAWAQQEDPADAGDHSAARVSLAEGNVSIARGDSSELTSSALNAPLVTTDHLITGGGSRAEIEFDSANLMRIAPNTEVRMGDLAYHRYLMEIRQGTTMFRVLRDNDAKVEISTPSVSVAPLRQGTYRVTVRPDGSSEITVRAGEAEVIAPNGSERIAAGQTMVSRGPANDPEFMNVAAIPYDDWDRWNADRDRAFERYYETSRYTGPDIAGGEDLAAHGRWVWDPAYGWVWVPYGVAADWAPYRNGRWDYLDYYGWSWVSYDPWGWAPYHYGNWYRASFGWAWYPGPIRPRYYWRPALVGFFGFGSGGFGSPGFSSLSFGFSNVGWVPLAPHERFQPWYGRGYGGRNINIVNNTNIVNVYQNARHPDAVTGLRAADFGRAGVGRNAFVRPAAGDLARSGVVSGGMPFAPARGSGAGNAVPPANVVPLNRNGGGFANGGGWRRLDTQQPQQERPQQGDRGGFRGFGAQGAAPQGGRQREVSEPVRISPPIVNNRGQENRQAAPAGNVPPRNDFGGFGGPRPGNERRSFEGFGGSRPNNERRSFDGFPGPRGDGGGFSAPPAQRAAPEYRPAPAAPPEPRGGGGFRSPSSGGNAEDRGGGRREGFGGGGFGAPPAQRAAPSPAPPSYGGGGGGNGGGGGFRGNGGGGENRGGGNHGGGGGNGGGGNHGGGHANGHGR